MAYPIIPIVFTWGTPYQSDERVSSARYEDGVEMVERVGINRRKQSIDVNVDITNPVPVDTFLRERRGKPFRIQTINQLLGEDLLFTCAEWELPEKSRGCWTFKAKFVQVRRFEEKTLKLLTIRTNKTVVVNGETATLTAEVVGFESFPSLVWSVKNGVGSVVQTAFNQAEYRAPVNTSDRTTIVIACEALVSGFLRFYAEVSLETVVVPSSEILEAYQTYIYGPRPRETFYCLLRTGGSALRAVNWRIMSGVATLDNPRSSESRFYVDVLFGQISALVILRVTAASDPNVWREYSILPALSTGTPTGIEASVDPTQLFVNESTALSGTVVGTGIFSPLIEWLLSQGSGTIATRRYTAGPLPETVILTAYALHASDIRRDITIIVSYRPGPTAISASANPNSIVQNGTAQLVSALTGHGVFDQTVIWSILSGEGSISGTTYTAGPNLGTVILRAASLTHPSINREFGVFIEVPRTITGITASANPTTIATDGTSALTAQLTGTGSFNSEVAWSVVSGGGSVINTLSGRVFIPSSNPSTVVLRAASFVDPTINKTVSITVLRAGVTGITASADPSTIDTDATTSLIAQLTGNGSFNPAVAWSIISGGGSITGTQYKAGLNAGTVTLRAESVSTPTINTTVTITVRAVASNTVTSVTALASTTTLAYGQTTPISAQVSGTGSYSSAVNWSIVSGGGLIENDMFGMQYRAGSVSESVVLRATSVADPSKNGTVTIAVQESVSNTVTSVTASALDRTLASGQTTPISAQVSGTGSYSSAVNWSIVSGGGLIENDMFGMQYRAGSVSESVVLRATSASTPSVFGDVTITVQAPTPTLTGITAIATPSTIRVNQSSQMTVQMTGTGTFDQNVVWSIVSGGGSLSGSSSNAMSAVTYTAGPSTGTPVLRATSASTPSVFGEVTITVQAAAPPDTTLFVNGVQWRSDFQDGLYTVTRPASVQGPAYSVSLINSIRSALVQKYGVEVTYDSYFVSDFIYYYFY